MGKYIKIPPMPSENIRIQYFIKRRSPKFNWKKLQWKNEKWVVFERVPYILSNGTNSYNFDTEVQANEFVMLKMLEQ